MRVIDNYNQGVGLALTPADVWSGAFVHGGTVPAGQSMEKAVTVALDSASDGSCSLHALLLEWADCLAEALCGGMFMPANEVKEWAFDTALARCGVDREELAQACAEAVGMRICEVCDEPVSSGYTDADGDMWLCEACMGEQLRKGYMRADDTEGPNELGGFYSVASPLCGWLATGIFWTELN